MQILKLLAMYVFDLDYWIVRIMQTIIVFCIILENNTL